MGSRGGECEEHQVRLEEAAGHLAACSFRHSGVESCEGKHLVTWACLSKVKAWAGWLEGQQGVWSATGGQVRQSWCLPEGKCSGGSCRPMLWPGQATHAALDRPCTLHTCYCLLNRANCEIASLFDLRKVGGENHNQSFGQCSSF